MIHAETVADWPVARDGYHWIDALLVDDHWEIAKKSTRVLVPVNPDECRRTWYEPLAPKVKVSALFRQLAKCDETEESIAAFAARFGTLTNGSATVPVARRKEKFPKPFKPWKHVTLAIRRDHLTSPDAGMAMGFWLQWKELGAVEGDTIYDWTETIRDLKTFTRLSDALIAEDIPAITKLINFRKSGQDVTYDYQVGSRQDINLAWAGDPKINTPINAARHVLLTALGEKIGSGCSLELGPDSKTKAASLAVRAPTLRHALWLQFALAIWDNKEYRACEVCGDHFLVSPDVVREDRTLCSPACKQKAHRLRRAKALVLADRKLKPHEIASKVGSGVATVKKWIRERKDK